MPWKTKKRRTAEQNGGARKTTAGIEKRLESLTEDRQTRMGCESQNGSKWTMGISDCCSKACWFEAWSRMGPERKTRARRLQKQRVIWETRETVPWKRSGCRQQAATRSRVRNAQSKVQNGNVTWSGYWKTTRG